jgi:predicted enzyme involved in methoxymalonyl-ACP biosynthesis
MIGVVICRDLGETASAWDIDTWLMSCRVLGRRVEEAMLATVVAAARGAGAARLIGTYVPTAKNGMVADHYRKLGFAQTGADPSGRSVWELDLAAWTAPALPMEIVDGSGRRRAPADPAPPDA